MKSYCHILILPKDIKIEYLKKLSVVDLINLSNTDKSFNSLLKDEYIINSLVNYYKLNNYQPKIISFKELVTVMLSKLTPKEIYYLYTDYKFIEPYLDDLRITIKNYY